VRDFFMDAQERLSRRMQSRSPDAASIAAELGHHLIIGLRVRRFLKSPISKFIIIVAAK
jgi:hypothetical protein